MIEAEDAVPEEMSGSVRVEESEGASGGKYVAGMKGAYENPDYLEFKYNAPEAGKYQMQVFHSNEDLAGSHSYNIKIIDKYAVVEVSGESDSPVFKMAKDTEGKMYYFVDCGDHDPSTLSEGDEFGSLNSVTDQMYGKDKKSGYSWGVLTDENNGEKETPGEGGKVSDPEDKAVYTNYQKALSNSQSDLADGKNKAETFRYAHNQTESGISPRYVSYKFELDPGEYNVTAGMSNTWGNAANPTVTLSAGGTEDVSETYNILSGRQEKSLYINLSDAEVNENGKVELTVKATSEDPTIQMTYISITDPADTQNEYVSLPPYGEKALAGENLPDDIYMGKLTEDIDRFIDFRNLKNDTDRYFFINTFSDDTFDEKTITLDLDKGENIIRIYNDNSWNVTYGGTQAAPGTDALVNYTPNFDRFIITPMALEKAAELPEEYMINVRCSGGGTAGADKNSTAAGGEYSVMLTAEKGMYPACVLVNGEEKNDDLTYDEKQQKYILHIKGVQSDQDVQVYFSKPDSSRITLEALYNEYKDLEQGEYADNSWNAFLSAMDAAEEVLNKENPEQTDINTAYDNLVAAINKLADNIGLLYFADCGDHGVTTLSEGDSFGKWNSVTDQIFGPDPATRKQWGVVDPAGENNPSEDPGAEGVYTKYTWANQNDDAACRDGQPKTATFRYARGQDYAAELEKISVDYMFELEADKTYDVEVCVGNCWGNSSGADVYANASDPDSMAVLAQDVEISAGGTRIISAENISPSPDGYMTVNVQKDKVPNSTVNVNYIMIREHTDDADRTLDSLTVGGNIKTEYKTGEGFSSDGMIVHAVYSDGTRKVLTYSDYTVSGFDSSLAGEKNITVSYTEGEVTKTVEFTVNVKNQDEPVVTPVNKDGLKASLEAAESISPDGYTAESYEKLQAEIKEARAVYENPDASQADVDNAVSELDIAVSALVKDEDAEGEDGTQGNKPGTESPSGDKTEIREETGKNDTDVRTEDQSKEGTGGPRTGDRTNVVFWIMAAGISGAWCVVSVYRKNKKR